MSASSHSENAFGRSSQQARSRFRSPSRNTSLSTSPTPSARKSPRSACQRGHENPGLVTAEGRPARSLPPEAGDRRQEVEDTDQGSQASLWMELFATGHPRPKP